MVSQLSNNIMYFDFCAHIDTTCRLIHQNYITFSVQTFGNYYFLLVATTE
jgi:hypothetical protein